MSPTNVRAPEDEAPKHRGIITVCVDGRDADAGARSAPSPMSRCPICRAALSATSDQITWVLTSYIVAAAIMTAPVGWLSSRFGRKNVLHRLPRRLHLASMLCGLAQNRSRRWCCFACCRACSARRSCRCRKPTMLDLYPLEQRGSAMAMWGMGVMVGPILGPTLGGYLTDVYDWRWVFYINLPFGMLAICGLVFFLGDTQAQYQAPASIGSAFSVLSLGIGALQLMLDRGEQKDWFGSTEIVTEAVLAGLGLYLFVVHVWLAEKPFIPPRIFSDMQFHLGVPGDVRGRHGAAVELRAARALSCRISPAIR